MEILDITSRNLVLFILTIILLINFSVIAYLIYKDRKNDKEEIEEILNEMKPLEKEKKIEEKEVEKQQDEKLEQNKKEVEDMLKKIQKDLDAKPEDVVSNFENEQEEKSIISYQELVKSVNDKPVPKVTPVKIEDDIIDIEEDDLENTLDLSRLGVQINHTFKNTDFISPIFGKQENTVKYPTVPKINSNIENSNKIIEDKKFDRMFDTRKLDEEIKKNDDFLAALKEFRKNLDS